MGTLLPELCVPPSPPPLPAFHFPLLWQFCATLSGLLVVPQLGAAASAADLITSILKLLNTLPHSGACPEALKQVSGWW